MSKTHEEFDFGQLAASRANASFPPPPQQADHTSYLKMVEFAKEIVDVSLSAKELVSSPFPLDLEDTDVIVEAMLRTETTVANWGVPFYHMCNGDVYILYELFTALAAFAGHIPKHSDCVLFRILPDAFGNSENIEDLLRHMCRKESSPYRLGNDHCEQHRGTAISANPTLFASGEASPYLFKTKLSVGISAALPPHTVQLAVDVLRRCGLCDQNCEDVVNTIFDKLSSLAAAPILMQCAVRGEDVEKIMYLAKGFGTFEEGKTSALAFYRAQMSRSISEFKIDLNTQYRVFADPVMAMRGSIVTLSVYTHLNGTYKGVDRVSVRSLILDEIDKLGQPRRHLLRTCFANYLTTHGANPRQKNLIRSHITRAKATVPTREKLRSEYYFAQDLLSSGAPPPKQQKLHGQYKE